MSEITTNVNGDSINSTNLNGDSSINSSNVNGVSSETTIINDDSSNCTSLGPGILYIFNHKTFDEFNKLNVDESYELGDRAGTDFDAETLQITFKKFNVPNMKYDDLRLDEICEKVTEISTTDFSNHSCIIIAILTHGFEYDKLAARDKSYHYKDIFLKISSNEHLKYKPKIYLIQSCRGDFDYLTRKRKVNTFKNDGPEMSEPKQKYLCHEQYILQSCTEKFVSYRHERLGSPFIQTFCKYLDKYGHYKPIQLLFSLVMIKVQKITEESQLPEITTTAVRSYVFGNYCTKSETTTVSLQVTNASRDGQSLEELTDDESSDEDFSSQDIIFLSDAAFHKQLNKFVTPPVLKLYSSQFTEDTRTKKGPVLTFIYRLFNKKVENPPIVDNEKLANEHKTDKWVAFNQDSIPDNVVVGGKDLDGQLLHIGRAYFKNGCLPGKVFLKRSAMALSYNGREIGVGIFEILVGKCYKWVKPELPGTVPINAVRGGWAKDGEALYVGRGHRYGTLTPGKIQLSQSCLYIPFGCYEVQLFNYEVLVKTSKV